MADRVRNAAQSDLKKFLGATCGPRFDLVPLAGDASNRRYYRLRCDEGSPSFKPLIVMELAAEPLKSEEVTNLKGASAELPYLNMSRFFESQGVRVPAVYHYNEAEGLIYLEDFGDLVLFELFQKEGESERIDGLYHVAIDGLISIQRARRMSGVIGFMRSFDYDLYTWEFKHFLDYAVKSFSRSGPAAIELSSSVEVALTDEFSRISRFLSKAPQCLAHRDYHAKNLMVIQEKGRGETLGIIDFQDALMAPYTYDLASLLRDAYTRMTDEFEESLYASYVRRASETEELREAVSDEGAFRQLFELSAIQRDLKAIGRFFYIDQVKKRPTHLPHVALTVEKVVKALSRVEGYGALKEFFHENAAKIKRNAVR